MISICHSINVQQESSLNYKVFLQFKNVCSRFSFYLILGNKCQFVLIVPIWLGSMSAHQKITTGVDLTDYQHPLCFCSILLHLFQHSNIFWPPPYLVFELFNNTKSNLFKSASNTFFLASLVYLRLQQILPLIKVACISRRLLIKFIPLMLTLPLCHNVITLSGFHFIYFSIG